MGKVSTKVEILVVGATGQQGGAITKKLLDDGINFRALSRSVNKLNFLKERGVDTIQGSLNDRNTLKEALVNIKQAFLVTTPFEEGTEKEIEHGINFVETALRAGVEHIVFSSVASSDSNSGIPHFESKWKIEQHIKNTGIPATILRPVFFMENFASPSFFAEIQEGKLSLPVHSDTVMQMVCLDVIGAFAAAAFSRRSEFIGQTIELASDELTFPEAVGRISTYSGKHIAYEELPSDQAEEKFGYDFARMFQWFDEKGFGVDIKQLKKKGIPLIDFNTYLSHAEWIKDI